MKNCSTIATFVMNIFTHVENIWNYSPYSQQHRQKREAIKNKGRKIKKRKAKLEHKYKGRNFCSRTLKDFIMEAHYEEQSSRSPDP